MATVTISSTTWYSGTTTVVTPVIGYESSAFRTGVIAFTVDSSASELTFTLNAYGDYGSGTGGTAYNDVPIYASVGTDSMEYVGQGGTSGTLLGTAPKNYTNMYTWTTTITGLRLLPGTTYYLTLYPGLSEGTYGWLTQCSVQDLEASGSVGSVYIHNGSEWVAYTSYIYNGSDWDAYAPYVYNGSSWDMYG